MNNSISCMNNSISCKVWEEKKAVIANLYVREGWPVKQVIKQICSDGFNPSETQLRSRLKMWRFTKRSRKNEINPQGFEIPESEKNGQGSSTPPQNSRASLLVQKLPSSSSTTGPEWVGSFIDAPADVSHSGSTATFFEQFPQTSPVPEGLMLNTASAVVPRDAAYPLSTEPCIPSSCSTTTPTMAQWPDTAGFIIGRGDHLSRFTGTPHLTNTALHPADDDEKRFTRVMASYRQAFLARHSHLPESQCQQLWTQKLNQFQFIPDFDNEPSPAQALPRIGGWLPGTSGKRTREDVNLPTLPAAEAASASGLVSGSGIGSSPRQAKRRPTTPELPVTTAVRYTSSQTSLAETLRKGVSLSGQRFYPHGPVKAVVGGRDVNTLGMVRSQDQQRHVSNRHPPARMAMGKHLDDPNNNQVPLYGPGSGGATILPTANTTSALTLGLANFGSTEAASLSNPHFEEPSPIVDASPAEELEVTRSGTTNAIFGGFDGFGFDQATTYVDVDQKQAFFIPPEWVPAFTSGLPYQASCPSSLRSELDPAGSFPFSSFFTPAAPGTPFRLQQASATASPTPVSTLLGPETVDMKPLISIGSDSSTTPPSRAGRRTQEQIAHDERPVSSKEESQYNTRLEPDPNDLNHMIRISTADGATKAVAAIPKASVHRPPRLKTYCNLCNDHPKGFHGEHELRRHIDRVHSRVRKVWVCVDISPDKQFLTNCEPCRNGKRYNANYNAAVHLRRTHFNPSRRDRGNRGRDSEKRGGQAGGNQPPMEVLKLWMREIIERADDRRRDTYNCSPQPTGYHSQSCTYRN